MKSTSTLLLFIWSLTLVGQDLFFSRIGNFALTRPVDIVSTGIPGDDRLFIVQKGGTIRIIDNISSDTPTLRSNNFLSRSVDSSGEGGLLGLAFDPDYQNNGFFYVYYTHSGTGSFTSFVSRYAVNNWEDNSAISNSETIIMSIPQEQTNHNGGDLAFSPEGYLFIGLGDGGGAGDPGDNGQDSTSLLGSILRIDVSSLPYTIPSDNPYAGEPVIPGEIWSHGWRNPWRFYMDNVTGNLIVGDVGQGQREEINIESTSIGGHNFGWNCYEGSIGYDLTDCENANQYILPAYEYTHSLGRSVTGGVVYRGSKYPALYGKYIFTDYINSNRFWILTINNDQVINSEILTFAGSGALSNVASIGVDNLGEMYAAEYSSGELYSINSTTLPLVLLDFYGEAMKGYNLLTWTTTLETNFDYFSIEKKDGDGEFMEIAQIAGKVSGAEKNSYQFEDAFPQDESLYRLKMMDLDGSFTYSKTILISKEADNLFSIYPIPANETLYLSNPGKNNLKFYIVNEVGKVVMNKTSNNDDLITIDLQNITSGIYYINIEKSSSEKFVRQFLVTH